MDVKKIFIILITIVACVVIGALVLNILLPNVSTALVNAIERMIYKATKMTFDFNGDGVTGSVTTALYNSNNNSVSSVTGAGSAVGVDGFTGSN